MSGLRRITGLQKLRSEVQLGLTAAERGDYKEYDEHTTKQLADQIKTRGRARLAALRKRNSTG